MNTPDTISGFELLSERVFADFGVRARLFAHRKTGGQVLALLNDDENRTFAISFRTLPSDSQGTPHVLEHSVLCGSEEFPLRDPFAILLKSSLHTFLNAFTSSLYTSYPVASQNEEDFHNLVRVYLDAVLHPLLTKETFERQAWHFELEAETGELEWKGVVLNEMRGRYAETDSILYRAMMQYLLPDTPFRHDSGGNPGEIPQLTYDALKSFHARCYHPSNAFVYLYGKLDLERNLEYLDGVFSKFERQEYLLEEVCQKPLTVPNAVKLPYAPVGEEDAGAIAALCWLIQYGVDIEREVSLALLSRLLYGSQAARLTRALVESGLGQKPAGFGLFDVEQAGVFSAGLRGIDQNRLSEVNALIMETLRKVADDPFPPDEIDAALNSFEFGLREQIANSPSKGMAILHYVTSPWLFRKNPFYEFQVFSALESIRKKLSAGEPVFERLVKECLLDNPHRIEIVLEPDADLQQKQIERDRAACSAILSTLTDDEKAQIVTGQERLEASAEGAEPEELVAKVPVLPVSAIDKNEKITPRSEERRTFYSLLHEPLETAEILYAQLCFDLKALPSDLIPYVPLFTRALTATGAGPHDYVKLTRLIQAKTGGVSPSRLSGMVKGTSELAFWFLLEGSCLARNTRDLFDIAGAVLSEPWLHNRDRCLQVSRIMRASLEESLSSRPIGLVVKRAQASLAPSAKLEEQMSGVSQLFFLRTLVAEIESNWEAVLGKLERIKMHVLQSARRVFNLTCPEQLAAEARNCLDSLAGGLPVAGKPVEQRLFSPAYAHDGIIAPVQVSYTGVSLDMASIGFEPKGSLAVVLNFVRDSILWDQIRVQGGAYGAGASYDETTKVLSMYSWDDPNPVRTIDVFLQLGRMLSTIDVSRAEIERNIVGTIGGIDRPLSPYARGVQARNRHFLNITSEQRQRERDEILAASVADFRSLGESIERAADKMSAAVIAPRLKVGEIRSKWSSFSEIDTAV